MCLARCSARAASSCVIPPFRVKELKRIPNAQNVKKRIREVQNAGRERLLCPVPFNAYSCVFVMKQKKMLFAVFALFYSVSIAAAYDPLGLEFPDSPVSLSVENVSNESAFLYVSLENVPEGYSVSDGRYPGWCVNPDKPLYYPEYSYYPRMYSSYETELPVSVRSVNWKKINYLINAYRKGGLDDVCFGLPVRDDEVQTLIWRFLGYDRKWGAPSMDCVDALQVLVDADGADYKPVSGESVGVICDNGNDWRAVFIEIPYTAAAPKLAGLAAALAMVTPTFGFLLVKKRK
jgi:hypothetical protein